MLFKIISYFFMLFWYTEMFLMKHLYQIAQLITNGHYIFKQLSESVAQIMSQKMFLKTPWISKFNRLIWTVERYSQPPVLKQNKSSTYSEPLTHNKNNFTQKCCSFKTAQAPSSNKSYECYIFTLLVKNNAVVTVMFGL